MVFVGCIGNETLALWCLLVQMNETQFHLSRKGIFKPSGNASYAATKTINAYSSEIPKGNRPHNGDRHRKGDRHPRRDRPLVGWLVIRGAGGDPLLDQLHVVWRQGFLAAAGHGIIVVGRKRDSAVKVAF